MHWLKKKGNLQLNFGKENALLELFFFFFFWFFQFLFIHLFNKINLVRKKKSTWFYSKAESVWINRLIDEQIIIMIIIIIEHEGDSDTNCNCRTWNGPQRLGKVTERVGNWRTSRDHQPKYSIVCINLNTEKSPGDRRWLAVTQTLLTLVWKTRL